MSDSVTNSTGVGICSTSVCTFVFDSLLACFIGDSDLIRGDEKLTSASARESCNTLDGAEGAALGDSKSPGSLSFLLYTIWYSYSESTSSALTLVALAVPALSGREGRLLHGLESGLVRGVPRDERTDADVVDKNADVDLETADVEEEVVEAEVDGVSGGTVFADGGGKDGCSERATPPSISPCDTMRP